MQLLITRRTVSSAAWTGECAPAHGIIRFNAGDPRTAKRYARLAKRAIYARTTPMTPPA